LLYLQVKVKTSNLATHYFPCIHANCTYELNNYSSFVALLFILLHGKHLASVVCDLYF